jgi:hypothetical protein
MMTNEEWEAALNEDEAWERSYEGIAYHLNLYPFVDDPRRVDPIVRTVMRLPDEVREYVYGHCRFV